MTPEEALEYLYLQSHRHLAYAFSDNPHADKCKSIIRQALAVSAEHNSHANRLTIEVCSLKAERDELKKNLNIISRWALEYVEGKSHDSVCNGVHGPGGECEGVYQYAQFIDELKKYAVPVEDNKE